MIAPSAAVSRARVAARSISGNYNLFRLAVCDRLTMPNYFLNLVIPGRSSSAAPLIDGLLTLPERVLWHYPVDLFMFITRVRNLPDRARS